MVTAINDWMRRRIIGKKRYQETRKDTVGLKTKRVGLKNLGRLDSAV